MNTKKTLILLIAVLLGTGIAIAQTEWTDHPENPVIGLGEPGEWDDGGRIPLAVHFDSSSFHLWFLGIKTGEGPGDIGHATSTDGVDWTMDSANPVLRRGGPGEWDDGFLFGAGVVHDGTQYHLWYSGVGAQTGAYQGGYATSTDGSVWTKHPDNPVLTGGPVGAWDEGGVDPHTVILEDGVYRMWYTAGTAFVLLETGYAESTDGVHWTKHPDNPVVEAGRHPGAWDSVYVENAYVIFDGATYHMWYTGWDGGTENGIGYAFSGDGIEWTKHGDSWIFNSSEGVTSNTPVYFDGSTFHMWFGQTTNPSDPVRIGYATSHCCALNWRQFIPAAAVASGAEGAFYQTDIDINNAGGRMAEYEISWLPRGNDNSEPTTSDVFTLDAGMSVRYANVLTEVFGLEPDSFGALLIRSSSPDLLAMSRTYNLGDEGTEGTYGQAMPAMSTDEFIRQGSTRRILFGSENAEMRTNVGCQNGTDSTTVVYLDLFAADGTPLGRETMMLDALGNDQVNRIFDGHNPMNGYVDVTPAQADKPVYCYGSVLDNATSDPTTIPPQ
jgi:hypothetical protein